MSTCVASRGLHLVTGGDRLLEGDISDSAKVQ